MIRILGLMITVMLLSACALAPDTYYYRLPNAGLHIKTQIHTKPVGLYLSLPSYLSSNSIAYQINDVTLDFSRQHLWAQAPKEGIAESLSNYLNTEQNQIQFVLNGQEKNSDTLNVMIHKFNGHFNGQVEVSGYVIWKRNHNILQTQNFNILIPQKGDGYSAMVRTLDQALHQVAKAIVAQAPKR